MSLKTFWRNWSDVIVGGLGFLAQALAVLGLFWLVPVARNFLVSQGFFGVMSKTYTKATVVWPIKIPWPHDRTDTVLLALVFVVLLAIVYAVALPRKR